MRNHNQKLQSHKQKRWQTIKHCVSLAEKVDKVVELLVCPQFKKTQKFPNFSGINLLEKK